MSELRAAIILSLCAIGCSAIVAGAAEAPLFNIQKYDIIYTKTGQKLRGRIKPSTDANRIEIQDNRGRRVSLDKVTEIKKIIRKATKEQEFERLKTKHKGDPAMLLRVAKEACERFRGLEKDGLALLQDAARTGHKGILSYLSERYLVHGQPDQAEATARKLLGRGPSPDAHLLLGRALMARGKKDEALRELNKAKALAPENQAVLMKLADNHLAMGQPALAREIFTKALDKNPRNIAALVGQGRVRLRQGEVPEAEMSFQRALDLKSGNVEATIGKAACKLLRNECQRHARRPGRRGRALSREAIQGRTEGAV